MIRQTFDRAVRGSIKAYLVLVFALSMVVLVALMALGILFGLYS